VADSALSPRVLLVDDHEIYRAGLRGLLEEAGIDIVGEAANGEAAVALVEEKHPNVVIMDLNMPGIGGIEAIRRINDVAPATRVMVLTITPDDNAILEAMIAGASGSIVKDQPIDELAEAIRVTALGGAWIQPRIARLLLGRLHGEPKLDLTNSELAALQLTAEDKDYDTIATALSVTPDAVREYVASALDKVQASC
jgi:DNA-binding NarL/FixJ family response regulator